MARDWETKVLILFGCGSILSFRCLSNDREDTRLAGKGVPCLGYFKVFKTIDDESEDFRTKKIHSYESDLRCTRNSRILSKASLKMVSIFFGTIDKILPPYPAR